jgi:hypothetical protein
LTPSTSITASGADSYSWSDGNGFTATTATATITATGTYTVIGTSMANGCTASASVVITQNIVTPTATITGNVPLCSGATINLTAADGATYLWTGPSPFTATTAAISIPNVSVANAGTYTVTVTGANGCTAMATVDVMINPVVAAPTVQALANIPTGGSVTLTATGCTGTLTWYNATTNAVVTMPVSPTVTTTYYAKCAVTANGITCESANSNTATVNVGDIVKSIVTGGAWNNPSTWDVGRVPLATDEVIIDSNHDVIITDMNAVAKKLRYMSNGKVSFGNPATKLTIFGL